MTAEPSREPSHTPLSSTACVVCGAALSTPQQRYCKRACQQRAYRLRQRRPAQLNVVILRAELKRRRQLAEHTVYKCPVCQTRLLEDQRCAECNTFARVVGLGGNCPECDAVVLLADLLGDGMIALR